MAKKIGLKTSKIHGSGVFVLKNIKKGETVFILKGKLMKFVVKSQQDALWGENWIGVGYSQWLDVRSPGVFLNHSCDPNCGIKGRVCIVAMRDISLGEEVTIDYSITEREPLWYLKCQCGSKICRHTIKSIQSLPKKAFHRYMPYIPHFFANIYKKEHGKNNY